MRAWQRIVSRGAKSANMTRPSATAEAGSEASATPVQAAELSQIPALLQGRWGLVPADCTSTKGDNKGLLTVGADKLEFYESVAKLGPVKEADGDSISAAFEFSGEGENWIQDVALSTSDGGKTLILEDTGPQAQTNPLTYKKCS